MKRRIVVEVMGGVVQSVYGDPMPEGVELDIIVRDHDNIEAGDDDPISDDEAENMVGYY